MFISARIITNVLLTGDVPLLVNYSIGLVLNALVILSALYFRMPSKSDPKAEKDKPSQSKQPQSENDETKDKSSEKESKKAK